jgi:hypothetical protein
MGNRNGRKSGQLPPPNPHGSCYPRGNTDWDSRLEVRGSASKRSAKAMIYIPKKDDSKQTNQGAAGSEIQMNSRTGPSSMTAV